MFKFIVQTEIADNPQNTLLTCFLRLASDLVSSYLKYMGNIIAVSGVRFKKLCFELITNLSSGDVLIYIHEQKCQLSCDIFYKPKKSGKQLQKPCSKTKLWNLHLYAVRMVADHQFRPIMGDEARL